MKSRMTIDVSQWRKALAMLNPVVNAKSTMPDVIHTEQDMVDHAGELVALAGVKLRPYVEVQQKFHEKLAEYNPKYSVKDIKEVAYVPKKR